MEFYIRTEDGVSSEVTLREGLDEINHAMMGGSEDIEEMSQISWVSFEIRYPYGRTVRLVRTCRSVPEPEPEPKEWHGTHSKFNHLHRFTADNRARCNRRIRANLMPHSETGEWGVFLKIRSEIENGTNAHLYTFCSKCEEK